MKDKHVETLVRYSRIPAGMIALWGGYTLGQWGDANAKAFVTTELKKTAHHGLTATFFGLMSISIITKVECWYRLDVLSQVVNLFSDWLLLNSIGGLWAVDLWYIRTTVTAWCKRH